MKPTTTSLSLFVNARGAVLAGENIQFAFGVFNGYYSLGSYDFPGRKFQLVGEYERFNPGQASNDNIESVVGGLNYYIKGDYLKLMLNYIHTWSQFRRANPGTGDDQFDEVLLRAQVMF